MRGSDPLNRYFLWPLVLLANRSVSKGKDLPAFFPALLSPGLGLSQVRMPFEKVQQSKFDLALNPSFPRLLLLSFLGVSTH